MQPLIACAVVAGNRWDGFLSERRTGSGVPTPRDGVLRGKEYYFRLPDDAKAKYPLVPTFAHWRFPHGKLPPVWSQFRVPSMPAGRVLPRQGSLTDALLARDISCRLTATVEGTEHAHLVPRTEGDWFRQNTMFQYGVAPRPEIEPIDVPRNALLLRSDIHTVFDQRRFAITLKPLPVASESPVIYGLAMHLFSPGLSEQFVKLYHRVAIQPLHGVAPEYLFARFAWTVFAHSAQFLQQGVKRVLYIVRDGETSEQEVNGDQCTQLYLSRKSRSLSPSASKRKRDDRGSVQEGDCGTEEQEDEDDDGDRYGGRARLRSPSRLAAPEATASRSLLAEDVSWLTDISMPASDVDVPSPANPSADPSADTKHDLPA
ncbi:hypothetical protein D6D19_06589 [Aureobasidium pullulans]|uniref:HNH nuclease domain-containing protein n=1 Tax=Aureobasidium pullulans TaxID=5580 RepID=A0A4S9A0F4_AURPU|nr:hypothetical protein D6D19_06589 [Aureobasidium pullulans]